MKLEGSKLRLEREDLREMSWRAVTGHFTVRAAATAVEMEVVDARAVTYRNTVRRASLLLSVLGFRDRETWARLLDGLTIGAGTNQVELRVRGVKEVSR